MPRRRQTNEHIPSQEELEALLMDDAAQAAASDFLYSANQFIGSALELTKLIVETEKAANQTLDRHEVLKIYSQ